MKVFRSKRKAAPKRTSNRALSLMLERTLIDEARSDKDLLLRMALKARGHADMAKAIEEAKRPKNILNAKVAEIAIKKLDDPAYAEPLIEDFIRSAFGHGGRPDTGEDFNYPPNRGDTACTPAQQLIGQMNDIDELKERLGIPAGGPGVLSKLLTPDVVTGVLGLVKVMITKDSTPQAPVRTYIIDMGGQLCGVSEHEYKKLVETGQIKEVGMLSTPAVSAPTGTQPPPTPAPASVVAETGVQNPSILAYLDAAVIEDYISMPPEAFVDRMSNEADLDIPYAVFLSKYLPTATYDDIVKAIASHKDNGKIGKYVEWIMGEVGKAWVESVLKAAKGRKAPAV